jgi:hypothetical protein
MTWHKPHHITHYEQQYNHLTWQVLWAQHDKRNIGGGQCALLEFLCFQINQVD